ncbi:unnamed protein product [Ascophyllum nodosum]
MQSTYSIVELVFVAPKPYPLIGPSGSLGWQGLCFTVKNEETLVVDIMFGAKTPGDFRFGPAAIGKQTRSFPLSHVEIFVGVYPCNDYGVSVLHRGGPFPAMRCC